MGQEDQISYWIKTSNEDWELIKDLVKMDRYLYALFFVHLCMEKLVKAHWVKCNSQQPPRSHDLIYLHDGTDLDLNSEQLELLESLNTWNIEGRYPDYKKSLLKIASKEFTKTKIEKTGILRQWLLEKLP